MTPASSHTSARPVLSDAGRRLRQRRGKPRFRAAAARGPVDGARVLHRRGRRGGQRRAARVRRERRRDALAQQPHGGGARVARQRPARAGGDVPVAVRQPVRERGDLRRFRAGAEWQRAGGRVQRQRRPLLLRRRQRRRRQRARGARRRCAPHVPRAAPPRHLGQVLQRRLPAWRLGVRPSVQQRRAARHRHRHLRRAGAPQIPAGDVRRAVPLDGRRGRALGLREHGGGRLRLPVVAGGAE